MLRTTTQFTPPTNFSKAVAPPAYSVQQQRQGAEFVVYVQRELDRYLDAFKSPQTTALVSDVRDLLMQINDHQDSFVLREPHMAGETGPYRVLLATRGGTPLNMPFLEFNRDTKTSEELKGLLKQLQDLRSNISLFKSMHEIT